MTFNITRQTVCRRYVPVVGHEDRLGRVNQTRFGVIRGVENFARELVGRSHDNETGIDNN